MIRYFRRSSVLFAVVLLVVACDSDDDALELRNRFAVAADNISSVSVETPLSVIEVDRPITLSFTSNDTTENLAARATWSSSNTSIATVSANGQVTGVADGTVTIQGSLGPYSDSVDIRVSSAPLTGIEFVVPEPVNECDSVQLQAKGIYASDDDSVREELSGVVWSVSNSPATVGVFSTTTNGLFRSSNAGTAVVTATRGDVSEQLSLVISDNLQNIVITPSEPVVSLSSTTQFTATAEYSTVADTPDITDNVSWSIDKTNLAGIDNTLPGKGAVSATAIGEVVVSATCGGVGPATVAFSIGDPDIVTSIEFEWGSDLVFAYSGSENERQLIVWANLQNGERVRIEEELNWTVLSGGDTNVLSVSNEEGSKGLLTVRGRGSLSVRVKYDGDRFDNDESILNEKTLRITVN